jgi:hypothetical protein
MISSENQQIINTSLRDMISHLDQVAVISSDCPDAPSISPTTVVHTGKVGRPRIEIDQSILMTGLGMRGSTNLASVFGVSSWTSSTPCS